MNTKIKCSILNKKRHFSKKSLKKIAKLQKSHLKKSLFCKKVVGKSRSILQKSLEKVYIAIKRPLKKSFEKIPILRKSRWKKSHRGQNAEEKN